MLRNSVTLVVVLLVIQVLVKVVIAVLVGVVIIVLRPFFIDLLLLSFCNSSFLCYN